MYTQRYQWLIWMLPGLLLAACAGGSGSSGFDIVSGSENAAIQRALAEHRCITRQGLTICPANETPLPTSTPQPGVDTGTLDPNGTTCVEAPSNTCSFALPFAPQGLPVSAIFRAAVREDAGGRWRIGEALPSSGTPSAPTFDAPVTVAAPPTGQGTATVQIAILAFLAPAASVPDTVDQLADSGADFAFVTPEVVLRPEAPGPS
jgi:hypothetical protein